MNKRFIVEQGEEGRLDQFLSDRHPEMSRGEVQEHIQEGLVSCNGTVVTKNSHKIGIHDDICIAYKARPTELKHAALDLPVIFEDDAVIVINKPAGIIVHPNEMGQEGTVVQALLHRDPSLAHVLYDPESPVSKLRPGIVHRLDKDTSGVLIVAKTLDAMRSLASQFHDHTTVKRYEALVAGREVNEETIATAMQRKPFRRNLMGVAKEGEGREAVTTVVPKSAWKLKESFVTFAEFQIKTGRTHQIRVHCKYKGYPVIGDDLYNNRPSLKISEYLGARRQMLHARFLTVIHPTTGQPMTFEAPLPEDMRAILTKLGPGDSLSTERGV